MERTSITSFTLALLAIVSFMMAGFLTVSQTLAAGAQEFKGKVSQVGPFDR